MGYLTSKGFLEPHADREDHITHHLVDSPVHLNDLFSQLDSGFFGFADIDSSQGKEGDDNEYQQDKQ